MVGRHIKIEKETKRLEKVGRGNSTYSIGGTGIPVHE